MKRFRSSLGARPLRGVAATFCACALVTFLLLLSIPAHGQHQQHQRRSFSTEQLHKVVREGQVASTGYLPHNQHLKFSIMLELKNPTGLASFLKEAYDPTNPNYRQFLTVDQFTERFAPTQADYQTVVDFAKANGFKVIGLAPNRLIVHVDATVENVETAFGVKMCVYQHPTEKRTFYSMDSEPTVDLNVPLRALLDISDFSPSGPANLVRKNPTEDTVHTFAGSGPGGAILGSDLRTAYYGGSALTGAGQTIGLFGVAFDIGDVTMYFQNVGQSFNSSVVQVVQIDGANTSCPAPCNDGEQMVDIMRSYSMAPGVSAIYEFEGTGNADTFNAMATHNPLPLQLSSSISYSPEDPTAEEPIFQEFAAQGQSFFQASGDAGAYKTTDNNGSSYYPAESSYAIPAGGTDLTTNGSGGSWQSETAWSGSGGGPSPDHYAIPSWQVGLANGSNGASTTYRNLPDVASESYTDNYFCSQRTCGGGIGGTSLSAPLWAGFMALVNQQAKANGKSSVGLLGPILATIGKSSSYTSDFHDITSGNNNNGQGQSYNAVTGYDLVTGWGSPNGQNLINALAGGTTTCSPTAITPYIWTSAGGWQQTTSISVSSGTAVDIGPQPASGGSWSWSGPNGYSSSSREIDSIPLSTGTNTFTATYTNSCGSKSTQAFTITVSGGATPTPTSGCTPNAITPYLQVGSGSWQQTTSATVSAGSAVNLGPQPTTGTWSWTGPNGYSSTSRQIAITVNSTSTYTATYTNSCGSKSTATFTLTVTGSSTPTPTATKTPTPISGCTPTSITPYIWTSAGGWQQITSISVSSGTTVDIGPQPASGGSWSWSGPNGYSSTSREIDSIPLSSGSNTFTATYTNSCGSKSTQAFTVTVSGGATPTPTKTATATATKTPTPGGGTCYAAWVSTTAYSGGATVSYNGVNYTAAFWTQGNEPDTNNGPSGSGEPWISDGSCSGS
ncbi:MAG: protease pro-enzyme activation domain-containing protein [Bryobacteraceae bacterium]